MSWSFRTMPEGFVEVDQGQGFEVPELAGADAATARVESWIPLARPIARTAGVPLSWVLGVMYAESQGRPEVENFCCVGLMAINVGVFRQFTREQWKDPATNLRQGAQLLGDSRRAGWQLPEAASIYNAGPSQIAPHGPKRSQSSPWGMVENEGYIERVVRATNFFRANIGERDDAPARSSSSSSAGDAVVLVAALAAAWWASGGRL